MTIRSRTASKSSSSSRVSSSTPRVKAQGGEWIRDIILGGQDGLVNVLGIVLGVSVATSDVRIVIVAGLAAMFAEGVSMGAVAYTSSKATIEYYNRERARESKDLARHPALSQGIIRALYRAKGFSGELLEKIVQKLKSKKERWLDVIMEEDLKLSRPKESPTESAITVTIAAIAGAFFPIVPYFFLPISTAQWVTVVFSLLVLFIAGALKGRFTQVTWWRSGIELAVIGTGAALVGFAIGSIFSIPVV